MVNHPNRSKRKRAALAVRTPFEVQRIQEKSAYRGLSIVDADGLAVCNVVFRLDDREVEMAQLICAAMNATYPSAP